MLAGCPCWLREHRLQLSCHGIRKCLTAPCQLYFLLSEIIWLGQNEEDHWLLEGKSTEQGPSTNEISPLPLCSGKMYHREAAWQSEPATNIFSSS